MTSPQPAIVDVHATPYDGAHVGTTDLCDAGACHQHGRHSGGGLLARWKRWWGRRKHRRCDDCDQEAGASSFGQVVNEHWMTQISNGDAARMVLYRYDFVHGSPKLKRRGRRELSRMAKMLPATFHPVIIQHTPGSPELDQRRRQTVLNELGKLSFPVPEQRVCIDYPVSRGLDADEATVIHGRLIEQTNSGGSIGGAAAGAATGGQSASARP